MQIRRVTRFAEQPSLRTIRETVFVEEQRVPIELEQDDRDEVSTHVLAELSGQPVGTARIDLEEGGKIGRVAVLREYRGQGIGDAIMRELHAIAVEAGLSSVWLNAQKDTLRFYENLGYSAVGEEFREAGIVHRKMELRLSP